MILYKYIITVYKMIGLSNSIGSCYKYFDQIIEEVNDTTPLGIFYLFMFFYVIIVYYIWLFGIFYINFIK